jgi:hypothetical protein
VVNTDYEMLSIAWNPDVLLIQIAPTLCACTALVQYQERSHTFAPLHRGGRQPRIDVGPINTYAELYQTLVQASTALKGSSG